MRALMLIGYLLMSWNAISSPIPDFPFVTVTGDSSRKVTPDTAVVGIEVVTYSESADTAFEKLNNTAATLLSILEKYKVSTDNITSHQLVKDTKRARENNGYSKLDILGYEFTQVFEIRLDKLGHYSEIADEISKMDNVRGLKSEFDVSNREEIEIELIGLAGKNAKLKAKKMALGLDVKLGSVFAINDTGSYKSFFATFGLDNDRAIAFGMPPIDSSFFVPKHIEISKTINVLYKLTP
ncbi:SIMPL domain-containing protein [Pseudoalteromonas sp. OOF1S-7]|uniref:SIMPL domain-containing protein n=1 Tax=Pseudoalteromonas sp. OOF1S-7 TaxID=2917757 RepID=UPI001EF5FEEE|nr:SIMPL domain-containing protein [Pseudoalteromonas sp. OOF1S-7]